jgi:Neuraminidase (sialidase)
MSSILSFTEGKKTILAFCNAADTKNRDNLTLRISYDEGKTWVKNWVIDKAEAGAFTRQCRLFGYCAEWEKTRLNFV